MVAVGAALGGVARHLAMTAMTRLCGDGFPWGTLAVNLVGSLLLGVMLGSGGTGWQPMVTVGFCGGLTTFSTFALQSLALVSERRWGALAANVAGSVGLCVLCASAGFAFAGGLS